MATRDRIISSAIELGCIAIMGTKHIKLNYRGKTLMVISKNHQRECYDIPAVERKLKRLIANEQT